MEIYIHLLDLTRNSCEKYNCRSLDATKSPYLHAHGLNMAVPYILYTAISIKVVHEQSGKFEYERERLLGTVLKIH